MHLRCVSVLSLTVTVTKTVRKCSLTQQNYCFICNLIQSMWRQAWHIHSSLLQVRRRIVPFNKIHPLVPSSSQEEDCAFSTKLQPASGSAAWETAQICPVLSSEAQAHAGWLGFVRSPATACRWLTTAVQLHSEKQKSLGIWSAGSSSSSCDALIGGLPCAHFLQMYAQVCTVEVCKGVLD
jgi:hypothetical protein